MKKITHLAILFGAVTAMVMLASTIAQAGTSVKTDECILTMDGGVCECTIEAKSDLSISAIYTSNADTVGPDSGFSIRDLSLNEDLVPGAGVRPGCDPSGKGQNNRGWFDIPHRISEECGSSVGYSPIPLERGDQYKITLVGYGGRRPTGDCDRPRVDCRNDILVDVRVAADRKFSLTCIDYYDDDDSDSDSDQDSEKDKNKGKRKRQ